MSDVVIRAGKALRPDLPEHERAKRIMGDLAHARALADVVAARRPDDRRFAVLAHVLGELLEAVFLSDDARSLDALEHWARKRREKRGRRPCVGGEPKTIQELAADARTRLERHRSRGGSRWQAAWLLTRALGAIVNAYSREERRPLVRKVYEHMPLADHGLATDREDKRRSEAFTADPKATVLGALRALDVPAKVVSGVFGAEQKSGVRKLRRPKKSDTPRLSDKSA